MKQSLFILFLLSCLSKQVNAQFFHPDPTFDTDGYAVAAFPGNDRANNLVVDASGRIVSVGFSGDYCLVARHLANGALDNSFGTNGQVVTEFGNTIFGDVANAVAVQPDGKIVVAGGTALDLGVLRLMPDGSFDPGFGAGGKVLLNNVGTYTAAIDVAILPDHKILMLSTIATSGTNTRVTALFRLSENGSLDTGFSGDGVAELDIVPNQNENVVGLAAEASGGKFVVAGNGTTGFVCRILPDGSLDFAFGTAGKTILPQGQIRGVSLGIDGKIVVAGRNGNNIMMARLLSNGFFDTSFGAAGMVITNTGYRVANDLIVQNDGKIIITGYQGSFYFLVARFNVNGAADPTFTDTGYFAGQFNGIDEELHKVVLQANGNIVCAGYYDNDFGQEDLVLLRLTSVNIVGTTDLPWAKNWSLQPNPAHGIATIHFQTASSQQVIIRLLDTSGRILRQQDAEGQQQIPLDCSNLPNGLYWVQVQSGVESGVQKLIIQH